MFKGKNSKYFYSEIESHLQKTGNINKSTWKSSCSLPPTSRDVILPRLRGLLHGQISGRESGHHWCQMQSWQSSSGPEQHCSARDLWVHLWALLPSSVRERSLPGLLLYFFKRQVTRKSEINQYCCWSVYQASIKISIPSPCSAWSLLSRSAAIIFSVSSNFLFVTMLSLLITFSEPKW